MFDFGFSELILIAVVMLVVVGPERLPKVARTAGHLLGRLQRYVSDVKSDIQREMQLEDLKKLQQQVEQQARDLESSVRNQMKKVESEAGKTAADVTAGLPGAVSPAPVSEARQTTATHEEGAAGAAQNGSQVAEPGDAQLELGLDRSVTSATPVEKA